MPIHQMDVETLQLFFYGTLDKVIYIQQAEGYVKPGEECLVCKVEKSLHELKQPSPCWNRAFRVCVEKIGFSQALEDPCVFTRKDDTITIIGVDVDDVMIYNSAKDEKSQGQLEVALLNEEYGGASLLCRS